MEGTLEIISFQPCCLKQDYHSPDQVDQGPTQPGLGHLQGWDTHSFSSREEELEEKKKQYKKRLCGTDQKKTKAIFFFH